jgi:hypothetical protein
VLFISKTPGYQFKPATSKIASLQKVEIPQFAHIFHSRLIMIPGHSLTHSRLAVLETSILSIFTAVVISM